MLDVLVNAVLIKNAIELEKEKISSKNEEEKQKQKLTVLEHISMKKETLMMGERVFLPSCPAVW